MESEIDLSLSQEHQNLYSPADIRVLQKTWPDLKLFIELSQVLTKKSGNFVNDLLTEQEIYCLKKLILKVRAHALTADDDDDVLENTLYVPVFFSLSLIFYV